MELLAVAGVLCVVAVNALAHRVQVSAPLLLVVTGVVVSVQPFVAAPVVAVSGELVLAGVLPLLLFAAAVSMPATTFRRNFSSISGLSVSLVVLTAVGLGAFFSALLPGLSLAGGIAIGAILSPTDAVATGIVKKLGVAPRVVAMLDGEALLNDASALVLLRAALAAMASAVSIGGVAAQFAFSVAVATAVGAAVGWASLRVRRRIASATVNTLLSFAVPFVAHIPAEHLGASGLVAVVAAGLVVGQGAPRHLPPAHRMTERVNWRTIEMLLEGGLFLVMGLELFALVRDVRAAGGSVATAALLAGIALAITIAARALWAVPLLAAARHRERKYAAARARLEAAARTPPTDAPRARRFQSRVRQVLADADYIAARPLGAREGVLLVWAGMRGAITLAAAQTLPADMPHRSLLVLVAFLVAAASLLLQGGTLAWLIRRLRLAADDPATTAAERRAIAASTEQAGLAVLDDPALRTPEGTAYDPATVALLRQRVAGSAAREHDEQFAMVGALLEQLFAAQRAHVLSARRDGTYSTEAIAAALRRIDALQLGLQLQRDDGPDED